MNQQAASDALDRRPGPAGGARALALALTVCTGFSGLVYEVTWQRYLATLLGSDSEATAAVLGLFLGGLALGYALFGSVTRRLVDAARREGRPTRLLRSYGLLECSIGVFALLFPWLFAAAQSLSLLLPLGRGGLSFALDVGLSALLVVPPAVMMGGTIPMLTQALSRSLRDATRFHAFVYAFNTVGAFAGALAAGYWLLPRLGLVDTLRAMACVNLLAGFVFVALGRRAAQSRVAASLPTSAAGPVPGFQALAAVALLVGFAMMTVQTVSIRIGGLAFGASQFTFSMVVAVFVLCIALGSFGVSCLSRIPRWLLIVDLWLLVILLAALYGVMPDATYWQHVLRSLFRNERAGFWPFQLLAFLGVFVALAPAVVLSGAALPLLFHNLRRTDAELGDVAGRLYSWNTVGSLLGALLGGYALLFWLDLHAVYRVALGAAGVAAVIASVRALGGSRALRGAVAGVTVAALLAAVAALPAWSPKRLSAGLFRARQPLFHTYDGPEAFFETSIGGDILFYEDDPVASITAKQFQHPEGTAINIISNGKSESGVPGAGSGLPNRETDYPTVALLALIPAMLAEKDQRAFVIGFGTGVTAGVLAALDSMQEVIVAEISPAVIRAAPLFDHASLGASHDPKLRVVRSDAYRALLRSRGSFDVIVSAPSNPWLSGIEMLFSREFLEVARRRLAPGGVHAQWFQAYETDAETIAMALRTYASVFDHVAVWYGAASDLILIGMLDPEIALDPERLARRASQPDVAAALERSGVGGLAGFLAHEMLPVGVIRADSLPGELHTLLHPRLGHAAARAFFVGEQGSVPELIGEQARRAGARTSVVAGERRRHGGRLPASEHAALIRESCRGGSAGCAALLAQWLEEEPDSEELARLLHALRGDRATAVQAQPGLLAALGLFYGEPRLDGAAMTPTQLARATTLFRHYYHHAAPFSAEVLAAMWARCEEPADAASSCASARAEAEQTLGPLADRVAAGARAE